MRDLAHVLFGGPGLADMAFAFHCLATAMKYADRAGLKGDADVDRAKADWYRRMVDHVVGGGDDPRSGRPGFEPWQLAESVEVGPEGAMLWGKLAEGGGPDGLPAGSGGKSVNRSSERKPAGTWERHAAAAHVLITAEVVNCADARVSDPAGLEGPAPPPVRASMRDLLTTTRPPRPA